MAGMIFQAIGIPHPRYTTLIERTVKRSPSVLASIAKASSFLPCHPRNTLRSRSAKHASTLTSRRLFPRLASASYENSRRRCRSRPAGTCSSLANPFESLVIPHPLKRRIPELSNPNTSASAFERLGSICPIRFCTVAIVATEEDIASSFGDLQNDDLFFFFGLFLLTVQGILASPPPPPSSQALSVTGLPGKRGTAPYPSQGAKPLVTPYKRCLTGFSTIRDDSYHDGLRTAAGSEKTERDLSCYGNYSLEVPVS